MTEAEIISQAMAILGKKGGKVRSLAKSEAARLNGARKFMSTKCHLCGKEAHSWHSSATRRVTVCEKCMTRYRHGLTDAERKKDVILVEDEEHHIHVDDRSGK